MSVSFSIILVHGSLRMELCKLVSSHLAKVLGTTITDSSLDSSIERKFRFCRNDLVGCFANASIFSGIVSKKYRSIDFFGMVCIV